MSANTKEIRELSEAEIQKKLREAREQRLNLTLRKDTGQVEHPHEFKRLRCQIARLETILREKTLTLGTSS